MDDERIDEIAAAFRERGYELHGPQSRPDGSYSATYMVTGGSPDEDTAATGKTRLEAAEAAWARFQAAEEAAGRE